MPPSLVQRRWPGRTGAAGPAALAAAAAGGVAAAASIPLGRPGLGWPISAFVGTAGLIAVARAAGRTRVAPAEFAWAAATLTLLAVGAVRAAGWLFVLCLLTAAVSGSLAVAGGRSVPRESQADRVLIRALLGALAALSLVVVASALCGCTSTSRRTASPGCASWSASASCGSVWSSYSSWPPGCGCGAAGCRRR